VVRLGEGTDCPRARRRRADAERNRARLLAAARAVFTECGSDAPLEQVAKHAKVGIATLYRNFPNRDDLVDALLADAVPELARILDRALADPDPWQGLVDFLEQTCLHTAADHIVTFIWRLRPPGEQPSEGQALLLGLADQLLERAKAAGRLRADVTVVDLTCVCLSVGHVLEVTGDSYPEAWRRHLGVLLDGLRAPVRDELLSR
jgi:AcrR family transcriptional regulator